MIGARSHFSLHALPMVMDKFRQALLDPGSVFAEPMAVVDCADLSDAQKIEILRRWEYDLREMSVAAEEGLQGRDEGGTLDTVLAALHRLGVAPDDGPPGPTKHGSIR